MNQSNVYGWGYAAKKVVKSIVMDPCAVVHLKQIRQGSKRPEHQVRPFHPNTHTHTLSETLKGLTSLHWLTFHRGRRGRRRDTFPSPSCPLIYLLFSSLFTTSLLFFLLPLPPTVRPFSQLSPAYWNAIIPPFNWPRHSAFIKPSLRLPTSISIFSCLRLMFLCH